MKMMFLKQGQIVENVLGSKVYKIRKTINLYIIFLDAIKPI